MGRASILVAENHAGFLACMVGLLANDFDVVMSVTDGKHLIDEANRLLPDALVVDISLTGMSGLNAVRHLKSHGCPAKVVFVSAHQDPDFVAAAIKVGAHGYVLKDRIVTDLLPALHEALSDRTFVSIGDEGSSDRVRG